MKKLRLLNRRGLGTLEVTLLVRPAPRDLGVPPKPVKLRLRIAGVEEFRFQKRPTLPAGKISDLKIGYFNGLYYLDFNAWGLPAGEIPGLHDYRASDAFVGGGDLFWEEVAARS